MCYRRLPIALAAASHLLLAASLQAGPNPTVKHPNLLLNREEIEQINEKIRKYDWAAQLFARVKALAGDRGRTENNPREAALMYALTGEKTYADDVRRSLVRQSERLLIEYGKLNVQQNPDFGAWGPYPTWAWAYDLTYDAFSADERKTVERLLRMAGRSIMDGLKVRTNSLDLVFGKHFEVALLGYCLGDQDLIDWGLNDPGVHGPQFGGFYRVLEANVRDKYFWGEAPRYALGRTLQGMMAVAEAALHYDGTDLYQFVSPKSGASIRGLLEGYLRLAYPMEKTGIRAGSIRMATFGDASTSYTAAGELVDTFLFNPVQGGAKMALSIHGEMELAYKRYRDPRYAWFLRLQPRRDAYVDSSLTGRSGKIWGYVALTHGEPLPAHVEPPEAPSGVYSGQGIAVLHSDESPRYWDSRATSAVLRLGSAIGHGHKDYFHLILHGKGRLLYPDLQIITYEPSLLNWTSEGVAHNTLLVDHQSPRSGPFTTRHDLSPEAKFFAVAGTVFDGVEQTRSLIVTADYVADLFQAEDREHQPRTFEWVQHGMGRIYPGDPRAYKSSDGLVPYFWWIDNERSRTVDGNWQVDWIQRSAGVRRGLQAFTDDWFKQTIGVRLTMLGVAGTEVFVGHGPITDGPPYHRLDGNPEGSAPVVVVRRKSSKTAFAAVHEPYEGRPVIKTIQRIDETPGAIGLLVEGERFSDRVLLARDAVSRQTLRSANGEVFSFHDHGYVRVTPGRVMVRGRVDALRVRISDANTAELILNGVEQSSRRSGDWIEFGNPDSLPPADAERHPGKQPLSAGKEDTTERGSRTSDPVNSAALHSYFLPEEIHLRPNSEKATTLHVRCVGQGRVHGHLRFSAPRGLRVRPEILAVDMAEGEEQEAKITVSVDPGVTQALYTVRVEPDSELAAAPVSLPVSVGVVMTKDNRIPLCAQTVVRSPGYTLRLDHSSGVSCFLLDGDGNRRHGPTNESMHGYLGLGAVTRDGQWVFRYRMPCRFIFEGPNRLIAVNQTGKDQVRVTYTFEEDEIRVALTPPTDPDRECTVWFGPFDVLGRSTKDKGGKAPQKEQSQTGDRVFFPHPVYRQGILVLPPTASSLRVVGDAFNVRMRTGQEVRLKFAEKREVP
jgi:hypothetical protein